MEQIDLNEAARIAERRNAINQMDLKTVQFVRAGRPVTVSPEQLESWKSEGRDNLDIAIQLLGY